MSIDEYYVLLSLSKTKSLTKTAEEFGLTAPSISKKLEKLEINFGQKIYFRKSKGIEFTRAGEEVIELCQQVVRKIESLQHKLKGDTLVDKKQHLTVSTTHGTFFGTLKHCVKSFVEENPEVELTILTHDTERELFKYNSDIIFWTYLKERLDLKQELIDENQFGLFASRDYLKSIGNPSETSKTVKHRVIQFTEFNTTPFAEDSNNLYNCFKDFPNLETIYVNGGITMYNMVKEGVGIGPVWTKHPNIKEDKLVRLFHEYTTTTKLYTIHRKDFPSNHPGNLFVDIVKRFLNKNDMEQ